MSFSPGDLFNIPQIGGQTFDDDVKDNSPQDAALSCPIIYGDPPAGTVNCGLPTDYLVSYDVDLASYAATVLAAEPDTDFVSFRLTVLADGLGYGKYGCRRDPAFFPDDSGTVDGCAVDDTRDGISIRSEMEITGDTGGWYDSDGFGTTTTHVFGTAAGGTAQHGVMYALSFGDSNGAYLINPSPPVPVPDAYGNTFGQVLWPVGSPPGSIHIDHICRGAHGPNIEVRLEVRAFRDDQPVEHGSTPSPGLMCVL